MSPSNPLRQRLALVDLLTVAHQQLPQDAALHRRDAYLFKRLPPGVRFPQQAFRLPPHHLEGGRPLFPRRGGPACCSA